MICRRYRDHDSVMESTKASTSRCTSRVHTHTHTHGHTLSIISAHTHKALVLVLIIHTHYLLVMSHSFYHNKHIELNSFSEQSSVDLFDRKQSDSFSSCTQLIINPLMHLIPWRVACKDYYQRVFFILYQALSAFIDKPYSTATSIDNSLMHLFSFASTSFAANH